MKSNQEDQVCNTIGELSQQTVLCLLLQLQSVQSELDKLLREMNGLKQIGKIIMTPHLTCETVLAEIIRILKQLLDVESGGFQLYDAETQHLPLCKPSFGVTDDELIAVCNPTVTENGLAVKVFLKGEPYICNDLDSDSVINKNYCSIYGIRSMLTFPLNIDDRCIGVIHVINKRSGRFTSDDVKFLSIVGGQMAMVIENARLLEKIQRQHLEAMALYQIGTKISPLNDLGQILTVVVENVQQLLRSSITAISLLDADGNAATMAAYTGDCPRNLLGVRLSFEGSLTGEVIATKGAVLRSIRDMCSPSEGMDECELVLISGGMKSVIGIPLQTSDKVIGILYVWCRNRAMFDSDEINLLRRFSQQATIAIENARLYERERKTIDELKESKTIIETQYTMLKKSMYIHTKLTGMVLSGSGIDSITCTLAELLDTTVIVTDQYYRILSSAQPQRNSSHVANATSLKDLLSRHSFNAEGVNRFLDHVAESKRNILAFSSAEHNIGEPWTVSPIIVGNDVRGYVFIFLEPGRLEKLDYFAIEYAATVFALEIMKEIIAVEVETRLRSDFVDDLLNGRYKTDEEILMRANMLGYDLTRPYQVILVEIENTDSYRANDRNNDNITSYKPQLFSLIDSMVRERSPSSIVIRKSEIIILLADAQTSTNHNNNSATPEKLAHLIKDRVTEALPQVSVIIGVGNAACQLNEFRLSYNQAKTVLDIMRTFNKPECVMTFQDLGIYKLLFHIGNTEYLSDFYRQQLGQIVDYDSKHGTSLLTTLGAYLNNNCNLRQTSRAMYLHLNTLNYRLQKIQNICGLDLDNSEVRLNLHVAIKIRQVVDHLVPNGSVQ